MKVVILFLFWGCGSNAVYGVCYHDWVVFFCLVHFFNFIIVMIRACGASICNYFCSSKGWREMCYSELGEQYRFNVFSY